MFYLVPIYGMLIVALQPRRYTRFTSPGTWYSTNAIGHCKENKLSPDCWWYVGKEKRTVNASCVDGNVVAAVQKRRPACWTACPAGQGTNISSACFLTCLFETLLGNSTTGASPSPPHTHTQTPFHAALPAAGVPPCPCAVHSLVCAHIDPVPCCTSKI